MTVSEAEVKELIRERDDAQQAIRGYQMMLDAIRVATGTAGGTKDDPPTDLRSLSAIVAEMRFERESFGLRLKLTRRRIETIAEDMDRYATILSHHDALNVQACCKTFQTYATTLRAMVTDLPTSVEQSS